MDIPQALDFGIQKMFLALKCDILVIKTIATLGNAAIVVSELF